MSPQEKAKRLNATDTTEESIPRLDPISEDVLKSIFGNKGGDKGDR